MGIFDFFKSNPTNKCNVCGQVIDNSFQTCYECSNKFKEKIESEGNFKDGIQEAVKTYHENGQLESEGNYKNGKKEGLWKVYYENGKLKGEGNYKNGKEEGLTKIYYENGQLNSEANVKNGKQEGLWKFYHENGQLIHEGNFKDGKKEAVKTYHENGQLRFERSFKDDKLEGLKKAYYENGQLKRKINYKNGKENGLYEVYSKNGQLHYQGNYKNGKEEGLCKLYHKNGQLEYENKLKDGKEEGLVKTYYENGQLRKEGNYKNGKEEGLMKIYHENGQLANEGIYKNGLEEGLTKIYYKNGQLRKEGNYKNGEEEGLWKFYYENGQLKNEGNYKNGEEEGLWKSYNENGQLEGEHKYKNEAQEEVEGKNEKMLHTIYPKLKGIDFSKVKFGASGNSAAEFFASDIDGDWHYAQSQMIMIFKAFSKDKFESELKLLLDQNEINFDNKIEKTEFFAEHWKGDGFQIEHPVMEGIDVIIITNEDVVPEDSLNLKQTDLAPEVKLPTGYENIGIENVYDGSTFLKANQGQLSLNIPLLFKDNDDSSHYILIGISTLTLAKRIIDDIIEKNYGKQHFKKLDEKEGWQYIFANKFFTIGFLSKYNCVRINMLHNLVDISQDSSN